MSAVAKLFMHLQGAQSGDIAGESVTKNFVGQIELDDWSWSLQPEPDPDNSTKKVPVGSVVSISKLMDRATTPMLVAMKAGDELKVTITLAEAAQTQFGLVIELLHARLIEYSLEAKSEERSVSIEEKWKIDYREISFDHRTNQQSAGSKYEKILRPAWASKGTPGKKGGVEKQIDALLTTMSSEEADKPGTLEALWQRIKKKIDTDQYVEKTEKTEKK